MEIVTISKELILQYHLLGVFISTMLFYTVIFPLPADFIVFFAGSLGAALPQLNPGLVGLTAGIAATIGGLVAYAIGAEADKRLLKNKHGKKYHFVEKYLTKYGFWAISFFAFSPLPMDIMGLLAGAIHYNWKKFIVATFIGRLLRCLLLAYAGYLGMTVILNFFHLII